MGPVSLPPPPPPPPVDGPWRSYKEKVASLADKVNEAQRPLRACQTRAGETPFLWRCAVWFEDAFAHQFGDQRFEQTAGATEFSEWYRAFFIEQPERRRELFVHGQTLKSARGSTGMRRAISRYRARCSSLCASGTRIFNTTY